MALVTVHYDEFLQFECFTDQAAAEPHLVECAGADSYFTAFRVTDVTLHGVDKFMFRPDMIYPTSSGSPDDAAPGYPLAKYQKFASVQIQSGHTFNSYGYDPMLIVRQVLNATIPTGGNLTPLSYENMGNLLSFSRTGSGLVETVPEIDQHSLQ